MTATELSLQNWQLRPADAAAVSALARASGLSLSTARLLWLRGVTVPEDATRFLSASLADMPDPRMLADISLAADRLLSAIRLGHKIVIYGDYDVDGVTSAATLWLFFRDVFNVELGTYIPHRMREGYGLNKAAISTLAEQGTKVLVTVDNGSSAVDEIAWASELGMDVIVIDHHQVSDPEPQAFAHLNPHRQSCAYPDKVLAAVGVVFVLLIEIRRQLREDDTYQGPIPRPDHYLDLVSLGTVADVAPLVGVNRAITRFGVGQMKRACRPGIAALLDKSGGELAGLSERDFGYRLGPRLNAAGRLDDATRGFRLLIEDDHRVLDELAEFVEEQNKERKTLQARMSEEALEMARASLGPDSVSLVLQHPDWHPGVVGIVASRMVDEFGLPTILLAQDGGILKGSARSVPGVDIKAVLDHCAPLLMRYGGHVAAAGMTLRLAEFDAFRERFESGVKALMTDDVGVQPLEYDLELPIDEFTRELYDELRRVGPFGHANPAPKIYTRGIRAGHRVLRGGHLKLLIRTAAGEIEGLAWNRADDAVMLNAPVDLVYTPDLEVWRGREKMVFRIEGMRPTEGPA
ncbi:MAG: single-stranded-DNA-specific exonuclease RecJ [Bradymonadia bacterium]